MSKLSLKSLATYFAERDYAVVVPDWGMADLYGANWSAEFQSAFCALAWSHANAETYALDLERVVVFGHSAGGFAASMIGVVDDPAEFVVDCPHQLPPPGWVAGVVSYAGVFGTKEVFLRHQLDTRRTLFDYYAQKLGLPVDEEAEILDTLRKTPYEGWRDIGELSERGTTLLHSLAPYWVDGSEPPFLLIHGGRDEMPIGGCKAFATQLQAAGVEAAVVVIPDAHHGAITTASKPGFEETCQTIEEFLAEVLK